MSVSRRPPTLVTSRFPLEVRDVYIISGSHIGHETGHNTRSTDVHPRNSLASLAHRRHQLTILPPLVQTITLPGLDFIKAWADCRLAYTYLQAITPNPRPETSDFDLPLSSFRHVQWNSYDEIGVLTDFDLDSTSTGTIGLPEETLQAQALAVEELMTSKAFCDNRSLLIPRDLVEPYVWMLVSAYLSGLDGER
ncbi:hypothetical protein H0H87_006486 [Tephrocybe sp. NHM501043]|nr:hypothetical protein H0H87_006486 [Tephrocybe sp. NHM501043]